MGSKTPAKKAPTKAAPAKSAAPFGGKRAAPFVKGGGRDQGHPRDAKGQPRQRGGRRGG